ncbi:hypothetical protein Ciccas_006874 [Cichlidogyrus casuarinus]|uniref:PDZ domain-containing protein n=1 Tax=Cichlidogyrus casuarinus TaxID=1844966 RepID=A0ABD2Q8E6_9PLAT
MVVLQLADKYKSVTHNSSNTEYEILPNSWTGLFEIKSKYYRAQAYYRFAAALLGLVMYGEGAEGSVVQAHQIDQQIEKELQLWMKELNNVVRFTQPLSQMEDSANKKRGFSSLSKKTGSNNKPPKRSQSLLGTWRKKSKHEIAEPVEEFEDVPSRVPKSRYEACQVGVDCLREAINCIDDVIRIIRLNEELRRQEILTSYVTRLLDDWKYQKDQLQPRLEELQKKIAPDQPLDMAANGQNSQPGTLRGRKALKKSSSSVSHHTGAEQGAVQAEMRHAAPRLLASPKESDWEQPMKMIFTEEFPVLEDPFAELGPIEIFNARQSWTKPATHRLRRDHRIGYGFSIKGFAPIQIMECEPGSPADASGLQAGDVVVGLNGMSAMWIKHDEAVDLVTQGMPPSRGSPPDPDLVEITIVRALKSSKIAASPRNVDIPRPVDSPASASSLRVSPSLNQISIKNEFWFLGRRI